MPVLSPNSEAGPIITAPICGSTPYDPWNTLPKDDPADKCVACAISNSVVASTIMAGAMIAASLFF